MNRYVLVDDEGYRVNTVLWDGLTTWDIPDGYTIQLEGIVPLPNDQLKKLNLQL